MATSGSHEPWTHCFGGMMMHSGGAGNTIMYIGIGFDLGLEQYAAAFRPPDRRT
jgi:hypothetical protein